MPSRVALARETQWERAGTVWDLYDESGTLLGWTLDIPARSIVPRAVFSYHTGAEVAVEYSPLTTYIHLGK